MKRSLQLLRIILIISLILTVNSIGQTATAPSAGDGSVGNPYQISSLDNLYWLSQNSSEWASGKYFIQTASIDASATSSWDGGNGFTPIGNSSTKFAGTYNGNGHSILGLYIDRGNDTGLFGAVEGGEIKNLELTNSSISGGYNTGALVGSAGSGTVISNCYSSGNITGYSDVGGLIGEVNGATVNQCFTTCTVSGSNRSGGFTGSNYNGTINNCYSKGDVTRLQSNGEDFGGFCGLGLSSATIEYCYSTGSVQYDNGSNPNNKGFLGNISGSGGTYKSNFFDYNTSLQSSDATGAADPAYTWHLQTALTYTTINNSWDFVNNPNSDSHNEDIWGINPQINDGYPFLAWTGYSNYLEQPSAGDGSSANPYQITDLQDLYWVTQIKTDGKYFIQTSNIEATTTSGWCGGKGFIPIGPYINYGHERFSGNYNGNGYTINELFINRESNSYIGMFSHVYNGVIKNIILNNSNITGGSTSVGALVGYLDGPNSIVSKCSSTGSVSGVNYLGGLVGSSYNSSTIKNSYSTCSVSGNNAMGGFIGYSNNGIIINCYCKGNIDGLSNNLGGFGGYIEGATIEYCYSTGSITYRYQEDPVDRGFIGGKSGSCTFTSNFFDSETSQQSSDAVGAATAKTTSEMKDYTTFTTAGWDFVDETDNGSNDYWDADQNATVNDGYVILSWQNGADNTLPVELITFSASVIDNKVNLNWQTATEVNNYGFNVERKTEIGDWSLVGFVKGYGNSNSPKHYSFIDKDINSGKYFYRLKQIDINGDFDYSKTIEVTLNTPNKFELSQNYPNPFNPTTNIRFSLPESGIVNLTIYNILGEKVTEILNKNMEAGFYNIQFNASQLISGTYIYSLSVNGSIQVRKMNLIK